MAQKTKIAEIRQPQANFDLYEDVDRQAIFVDGVAASNIGAAVSKLDLYESSFPPGALNTGKMVTVGDPKGPVEQRSVTVRIVIPTRALLDFCLSTLKGLQQIDIPQQFDKDVSAMRESLNSVEFPK
jgi:hypothetical protein